MQPSPISPTWIPLDSERPRLHRSDRSPGRARDPDVAGLRIGRRGMPPAGSPSSIRLARAGADNRTTGSIVIVAAVPFARELPSSGDEAVDQERAEVAEDVGVEPPARLRCRSCVSGPCSRAARCRTPGGTAPVPACSASGRGASGTSNSSRPASSRKARRFGRAGRRPPGAWSARTTLGCPSRRRGRTPRGSGSPGRRSTAPRRADGRATTRRWSTWPVRSVPRRLAAGPGPRATDSRSRTCASLSWSGQRSASNGRSSARVRGRSSISVAHQRDERFGVDVLDGPAERTARPEHPLDDGLHERTELPHVACRHQVDRGAHQRCPDRLPVASSRSASSCRVGSPPAASRGRRTGRSAPALASRRAVRSRRPRRASRVRAAAA